MPDVVHARRLRFTASLTLTAVVAALSTGCGVTRASAVPEGSCGSVVSSVLGGIAKRIYTQAASGRNVSSAVKRLARSAQLSAAVAAGDPVATRAALKPLMKAQIRDVIVTRHGHVLAETRNRRPALAPTRGVIRDGRRRIVGHYVIAVADDHTIQDVAAELTGARIAIMRAGHRPPKAPGTRRVSFAARAFPSGHLRIFVTVRRAAFAVCGATPAETVMNTVRGVGLRLIKAETEGPGPARVLRHVALDPRFRAAVAGDDPAALRTAIIRFFRTHSLHVVRIRATTAAGQLVNDVGGPYVLSPASRTLRDPTGGVIGQVTLSIQDDTGYIKLMHRFTGVDVVLQTPAGVVPGSSLDVARGALPASGAVSVGGRSYDVTSLQAEAFPSGPLGVYLLLPLPAR